MSHLVSEFFTINAGHLQALMCGNDHSKQYSRFIDMGVLFLEFMTALSKKTACRANALILKQYVC